MKHDVGVAALGCRLRSLGDHFGGTIDADYPPRCPNSLRRQERIETATGAEVQYGFTFLQFGQCDRVAAPVAH